MALCTLFVVCILSLCLVKLDPSLFIGLCATSMLNGLDAISDAVCVFGRVILAFVFIGCFMLVCFLCDSTLLIKCGLPCHNISLNIMTSGNISSNHPRSGYINDNNYLLVCSFPHKSCLLQAASRLHKSSPFKHVKHCSMDVFYA